MNPDLTWERDELRKALLAEMMAAHQRQDPHHEDLCLNCTRAVAALSWTGHLISVSTGRIEPAPKGGGSR